MTHPSVSHVTGSRSGKFQGHMWSPACTCLLCHCNLYFAGWAVSNRVMSNFTLKFDCENLCETKKLCSSSCLPLIGISLDFSNPKIIVLQMWTPMSWSSFTWMFKCNYIELAQWWWTCSLPWWSTWFMLSEPITITIHVQKHYENHVRLYLRINLDLWLGDKYRQICLAFRLSPSLFVLYFSLSVLIYVGNMSVVFLSDPGHAIKSTCLLVKLCVGQYFVGSGMFSYSVPVCVFSWTLCVFALRISQVFQQSFVFRLICPLYM